MRPPFKLLLIGDSDSQLLACETLCRFPSELNVQVTINAIPREGTPELILQRAAALGDLWRLEMGQLLTHPELHQFDAIGVYLTGSKISDFRVALDLLPSRQRPLLFCGFNGVVLEKFMEGMSWRLGYDLICLSGPRDREAMERMLKGSPFAGQRTVLTGLHRQNTSDQALLSQEQRRKQLVFAEQVVMPSDNTERGEMVRILADLARRSPDWEVLIKPRIAPGESTFHAVAVHISSTLKQTLGCPPTNLKLDYRPLPQLLLQSRLLATVSSTAFFDALDMGCKPVVMGDFGMNPANGSHVFAGSGVWRTLDAVEDLDALDQELPEPDANWLAWMGYGNDLEPKQLIHELESLRLASPQQAETIPGYITNAKLSFTQLRRDAETAIQAKNWEEAISLLKLGVIMRPTHRNVARRLRAVSTGNRLIRSLLLIVSYRNVG
jgi:hypothetical protein